MGYRGLKTPTKKRGRPKKAVPPPKKETAPATTIADRVTPHLATGETIVATHENVCVTSAGIKYRYKGGKLERIGGDYPEWSVCDG